MPQHLIPDGLLYWNTVGGGGNIRVVTVVVSGKRGLGTGNVQKDSQRKILDVTEICWAGLEIGCC